MLVFCTFGSSQGYIEYCIEAKDWISGRYSDSRSVLYNPDDLPQLIRDYCVANPKGYGLYRWKPWIVHDCMKSCSDNDILLYVDARSEFPSGRCGWLDRFVFLDGSFEAEYRDIDLLVYLSTVADPERTRSTADLLHAFGNEIYSYDAISGHIGASFFALRVNQMTRALVSYWHNFYEDYPSLCCDNESLKRNHPKFVHNRYDQSVFSLTIKKFIRSGVRVGFLDQDEVSADDSIHFQVKPHPGISWQTHLSTLSLTGSYLSNNIAAVRSSFAKLDFTDFNPAGEIEKDLFGVSPGVRNLLARPVNSEPIDADLIVTLADCYHPDSLVYLEVGIKTGKSFLATGISSIRPNRFGVYVGIQDDCLPPSLLESAKQCDVRISNHFPDENNSIMLISRDTPQSLPIQDLMALRGDIIFNIVYWNGLIDFNCIKSDFIQLSSGGRISSTACTILVAGLEHNFGPYQPKWRSVIDLHEVLLKNFKNVSLHGVKVGTEIGEHAEKQVVGIIRASNLATN